MLVVAAFFSYAIFTALNSRNSRYVACFHATPIRSIIVPFHDGSFSEHLLADPSPSTLPLEPPRLGLSSCAAADHVASKSCVEPIFHPLKQPDLDAGGQNATDPSQIDSGSREPMKLLPADI